MYNVMIVDDELWFRSYLKELIDQSGSEFLVCAQAANGAEALKILAAQPVDVVIADVLMPVMDGVELMQHLSDLPHRLPVLALSNCDDYLHVRQMLQLGAQDYLLKHEISAAALREHLQRAADWIRQQATVSSEHGGNAAGGASASHGRSWHSACAGSADAVPFDVYPMRRWPVCIRCAGRPAV